MNKYFNEITNFLDEKLGYKNKFGVKNYITDYDIEYGKWCIRYPGATRGYIDVDENMIIKDIGINDLKIYCYSIPYDELTQILTDKFKGTKLELYGKVPVGPVMTTIKSDNDSTIFQTNNKFIMPDGTISHMRINIVHDKID